MNCRHRVNVVLHITLIHAHVGTKCFPSFPHALPFPSPFPPLPPSPPVPGAEPTAAGQGCVVAGDQTSQTAVSLGPDNPGKGIATPESMNIHTPLLYSLHRLTRAAYRKCG